MKIVDGDQSICIEMNFNRGRVNDYDDFELFFKIRFILMSKVLLCFRINKF